MAETQRRHKLLQKTLSDFDAGGCLISEMREKTDVQLLRDYAGRGDESSFREIVARHTDLVYSAALRRVGSPDLAGDVVQSVFCDLAAKARPLSAKLAENASLVGWLYRGTRFAAFNQLREDRRRTNYERLAMEQLPPDSETPLEWERIRPLLDEAMDELSDEDRDALLVRYFKNQDFHAVGHALGVSDDAAQKRVSRAVERLRKYFARRGVAIGAGGLALAISAHAVQTAPAGLVAAISTYAVLGGASLSTSTAVTTVKTIAMTTLQKTLVTAIVVASVGGGIYEAHQASSLGEKVNALEQQQAPLADQLRQFQQEHDKITNQVALLAGENEKLRSNQSTAELLKLRSEVARLRTSQKELAAAKPKSTGLDPNDPELKNFLDLKAQAKIIADYLQQMPDKSIPELKFLKDEDWLPVARSARFDTDEDIRKTLRDLREKAKHRVPMADALTAYTRANNGQLPGQLSDLVPYFQSSYISQSAPGTPPLDDATVNAIFSRYTLLHTGNLGDYPERTFFVGENAPVDKDYDTRVKFGPGSTSITTTGIGETGDPEAPNY